MGFNRFGGSNNFLIWIILIVIALGFGKCGNPIGVNLFKTDDCCDHKRSRRHHKDECCYVNPIGAASGVGGLNSLFAGNGLFILLLIVLLFLCKEKKEGCNDDIVVSEDTVIE